jgi:hypothetical protein
VPGRPEAYEAQGDEFVLRFLFQPTEAGFDSLHVACMTERLASPMETRPELTYEYDFISGAWADRRALDSAFVVTYDVPINGQTQWRQRNLTIVGGRQSLCVIANCPLRSWKKSKDLRRLLDAVIGSLVLRKVP